MTMKAAFLLLILLLSALYTYMAFADLNYLSSAGRLGPGFFPRTIGVGLILFCVYSLVVDARRPSPEDVLSPFWHVAVVIAGLSAGFVALLNVLGGLYAMIVFLMAALTYLNRGRPVQNLVMALVLPVSVYVLFDVWLNAAMPRGLIPLPL